jgi:ABC-type multidrug transport system ATPase subunit
MPHQLAPRKEETVEVYLQRFAVYYDVQLTNEQMQIYCAHYQLPASLQVIDLTPLQARILSLALALVHDPRLALFDEPLTGLNEAEQEILWTYLQGIQREGRTVICTFKFPLAEKYLSGYDLIMKLEQGRLLRQNG